MPSHTHAHKSEPLPIKIKNPNGHTKLSQIITFMAESSSSNNNGSSLVNLAHDHLFPILLRLPIDSILSFAMTCKRFRSLRDSDFLWESLCKRDYGESSVNALKALNPCQIVPWMRLYKQVFRLECVSWHKLSDTDGDLTLPNPRASHSLNFVSNCLVLFGGGCEGGRHLDDTWVAYIGNDFRKMSNWQKINSGIPSGRFGHSCVVSGDYLVLFGGINDRGNRHNDTWVGQVSYHENHSITLSWRLLDVGSNAPSPRGAHAACCIDNRKMVVHGGIGFDGLRLGDTWVLEISENFCFGSWHEVMTLPSPPARSGHTLTYTGRNQLVLFGGRGAKYEVLSDLWFLDVSEGSFKWLQIPYILQNIPEGFSLPRVGHSATLVLGGWVLIHGGEDSLRHRKNDFWALNIKAIPSARLEQCVLNGQGFILNVWKRVATVGYEPNSRSFHRACADYSGRYLYVFGGMVDGLLQAAEPAGLRFNGELLLVDLLPLL